ncbi:BTAD domain-containing putative transcriptional regulator [Streptomyces sp. NPDC055681]
MALVQVGPDISKCFPTFRWRAQVGRFCATASSGWAGSRPRSPVSATSFACLSTHPRSSPAEPCSSLPVNWPHGLARPAHAGAPPLGAAGGALQVYRSAQPVLRSELGLQPCRSLRRLHQANLTSDRLLDLPVAS